MYDRSIYLEKEAFSSVIKLLKKYDDIDMLWNNEFKIEKFTKQFNEEDFITIYLGERFYGWDNGIKIYDTYIRPIYYKKYFEIYRRRKLERLLSNE